MDRRFPFLRNAFVSALLFGLFAEWLRPFAAMGELTDMYRLLPFLGAIGFYMFVDITGVRDSIGWPVKAAFTVLWVAYWFRPEAAFSAEWLLALPLLLVEDARSLLSGGWLISPETRTLLFLAGWAALVYAVQRIVEGRGRALWFVGATLCFLAALQLWPGIDTTGGILRAAAIGLLLLTSQQGPKWERLLDRRFAESRSAALSRLGAGLLCAAVVFGAGFALSAGERDAEVKPISLERWANWARAWAESAAERGVMGAATAGLPAATGYGADDSRLGRGVAASDAPAFEAVTAQPTYWRGESKDVYDGRGWRSSAIGGAAETFRGARAGAGEETVTQRVDVLSPALARNVFAGGRVLRFTELLDEEGNRLSDIHLRRDAESGAYFVGTSGLRLASYRMETSLPERDPAALLADAAPAERDPSERYVQLPESLPERVRQLARSIVAGVPEHPYLRAAAIQSYLQQHYRYTLETSLPPEGADFVDHFLFESKEGYCNHFSTAMVVLLRALDIEARWVKGFAPGTPDPDRPNTYVVKQSDAHSWVEVRFAQAGWVPFEATPPAAVAGGQAGFAGLTVSPANMQLAPGVALPPAGGAPAPGTAALGSAPAPEAADAAATASPAGEADASWAARVERTLGEAGAAAASGIAAAAGALDAAVQRLTPPARWAPLLALGAGGAAAAAALLAAALAARRLLRRRAGGAVFALRPSAAPALGAAAAQRRRLDRLWRRIYRRYGARPQAETLRDYASRLAAAQSPEAQAALIELVRRDEAIRYGAAGERVSRRWLDSVWKTIAK